MQLLLLTSLAYTPNRPIRLSTVYLGTHLAQCTTPTLYMPAHPVAWFMIHTLLLILKLVKGWRIEAIAAI
ncbi:predicted protein [Plenodomus lingam JN3]|uniref:Predicted protein n=1 Tax=Leptosphaeria maculans (strain JN3 / isolate v23.1.3 / race Av1-4-5-6-7-8) TaxID=985895 RepID=E4ZS89_LEPMJ|nr:predicted protein [Plenodomus lingam JN3]CBX94269.1 predicted protein [Plenodomus lingam JN3]